jgi:alpha-galactosidase
MSKLALATIVVLLGTSAQAAVTKSVHKVGDLDLEVTGDLQGFALSVASDRLEQGLAVVTLKLSSPRPASPPALTVRWGVPSHGVAGQWTPQRHLDKGIKPDWARSRLEPSMFAKGAPVVTLFGGDNRNVLTFAASDALDTVLTGAGVREEDGIIYSEVQLFTERHQALAEVTVQLRLDRRPVPYHQALRGVSDWWAEAPGQRPAAVPVSARSPMYSTWYNFHQALDPRALLAELAVGKTLGLDTVIVDDGWQTMDEHRGYAFTGDWRPERFPDMKGFVEACHKLGVKVMLWYAVPFIGQKAKVTEQWKTRTLRLEERMGAYVLDPRYPEVRKMVIGIYDRALRDWGIDGFKLDFIERFTADPTTVLEARDGRDLGSVNEATDRMMTDVMGELRKVRSDVMIEFRQPYIGPLIRKYGNMFRAGDCPNSYLANRVKTIDLRLLSGETAVHSDMIMWHPGEAVESAALQLLNVMFSVPQVSVRLQQIPAEQLEMLRFYLGYWTRNRQVLLDGALAPLFPAQNYPVVWARTDDKQIAALYSDAFLVVTGKRALDVINAKSSTAVPLVLGQDLGSYRFTISDCRGHTVKKGRVSLRKGTTSFEVPPSGLLALEPV